MSGRKSSKKGAGARRSQPAANRTTGANRSQPKAAPTPRQTPRQSGARAGGSGPGGPRAEGPRAGGSRPAPASADSGPRRPQKPEATRRTPSRPAGRPRRDAQARRKRNTKIGVWVGALALVGGVLGSVIAGRTTGTAPASRNIGAAATSSAAVRSSAAPTSATPTTAAAPASPTGPVMAMTCPSGAGASPVFGHDITAAEPYKVTITYGDGDKYTDTSAHLAAIFSHTYKSHGSFTVHAVLTDPAGLTTTAFCDYIWSR